MNRLIITVATLLVGTFAYSQQIIDDLVMAEKNFAAYSVVHGVKQAFLKFADSAGIVFDNGKPVNAIAMWTQRQDRPGKLDWHPEHAEIAASGDLGFTSGPWFFSINDTIRGQGYFNSVWHVNKKGEWKFLVDLGVGGVKCDVNALKKNVSHAGPDRGTEASLKEAEQNLISAYRQSGKTAYTNFLSSEGRLYRNGRCVAYVVDQHSWVLDSLPSNIQYTIDGSGIASSGDIGYVYGTTIINGRPDSYLRIWRREKQGWRIALEVLRY